MIKPRFVHYCYEETYHQSWISFSSSQWSMWSLQEPRRRRPRRWWFRCKPVSISHRASRYLILWRHWWYSEQSHCIRSSDGMRSSRFCICDPSSASKGERKPEWIKPRSKLVRISRNFDLGLWIFVVFLVPEEFRTRTEWFRCCGGCCIERRWNLCRVLGR